jgi:hypothetical protein
MTLRPDPKYPNRRAYVLKLGSDARPDSLAGRLENLVTGAQLAFGSGQELLDMLACELAVLHDDSTASPGSAKS